MARQLESYRPATRPGPDSPYDWDRWLQPGTVWKIEQGVDFDCRIRSFIDLARRHAKKRGVPVSIYRETGGVVIVCDS